MWGDSSGEPGQSWPGFLVLSQVGIWRLKFPQTYTTKHVQSLAT